MTPVLAYTDGSHRDGQGVAAYVILDIEGTYLEQAVVGPFPAANVSIAELEGMRAALAWLHEHGHSTAVLHSDAKIVIESLGEKRGWPRGPTRPHWYAVALLLRRFARLDINYVPRHTPQIRVCDQLCRGEWRRQEASA